MPKLAKQQNAVRDLLDQLNPVKQMERQIVGTLVPVIGVGLVGLGGYLIIKGVR